MDISSMIWTSHTPSDTRREEGLRPASPALAWLATAWSPQYHRITGSYSTAIIVLCKKVSVTTIVVYKYVCKYCVE